MSKRDESAPPGTRYLVITPYLGECCTNPHVSIAMETASRASAATGRVRKRLRRCGYDLDASITYSAAQIAALFEPLSERGVKLSACQRWQIRGRELTRALHRLAPPDDQDALALLQGAVTEGWVTEAEVGLSTRVRTCATPRASKS